MVATVMVRNFSAVAEVLEELGVAPTTVLNALNLSPDLFVSRENRILFEDLGRLVEQCVQVTHCDDFGLRVGMREDASAVGLAGLMSLNSATVAEALQVIAAGLRISDTGGLFSFEARNGALWLSYGLVVENIVAGDQIIDGAVAIICNLMRQLCGPDWKPDRVTLTRRPPREPSRFRQFFGAPVDYGASAGCLVCDASVLKRAVVTQNADHRDILAPFYHAAVSASGVDLVSTIRAVMRTQAHAGRLTRLRIAQVLGLSENMLVSRLAEANVTFSALADETKYELARKLLASGKDLRLIAGELGFADASAFNRAFVKWSGQTPGRWRADWSRRRETAG